MEHTFLYVFSNRMLVNSAHDECLMFPDACEPSDFYMDVYLSCLDLIYINENDLKLRDSLWALGANHASECQPLMVCNIYFLKIRF